MEFNDLPKQKQLLIFMLNREVSTNSPFTLASCGDEVIANGISANKNSLANMLYTLCQKKHIEKIPLANGSCGYLLSEDGEDEAEYWMAQCDSDMEAPESIDSLCKTEEHDFNSEAYAKLLEQGIKDVLFKLNCKPKQYDELVKAQAKEIERLKAMVKDVEAENDSLRFSEKMARDNAACLAEQKVALENERDNLQKSFYSIDEQHRALAKENEELSTKVAILKKSLESTLADLDSKNKKIEHLEDSIDKFKHSLTEMAEWVGQMKNGST